MLNTIRLNALLLGGLTFLVSTAVLAAETKELSKMTRNLLMENSVDLSSKTINTKVIKVILPIGYTTPKHTHEGPGPRYVSKGQVKVNEGDKTNTFNAGEVFWESGALMSVENIGKTEAELIIFELAPSH